MKTFEATCRIVTPLFMGGASQQPELRTQSINGVLRWWFRVAGGSLEDEKRIFGWAGETSNQGLVRIRIEKEQIDIMEQMEENKKIAIAILNFLKEEQNKLEKEIELREQEGKIKEKNRLLKMKNKIEKEIEQVQESIEKLDLTKNNWEKFSESENLLKESENLFKEIQKFIFLLEGCGYLGFSLMRNNRDFRAVGLNFNLKISFHPKATDDDIKKFFSALWLAFNLGNFGSRARRGFGAIKIEEIREKGGSITNNCYGLNFVPSDDLKNWINNSLDKIRDFIKPNERQEIPYLFKDFEIYQIQKDNFNHWKNWIKEVQEGRQGSYLKNSWSGNSINNWLELLGFMGFLLMAYRSYRKPDYDVAKNILLGGQVSDPTFERAIFGLPLNFYFSSINKRDMVHLKLGNETLRRASPLMIKIIQTGTKQDEISYEGLFIIMKSTFMPANARLVFSNERVNLPSKNIWKALDEFLSTLQNNNLIRRIYP